MTRHLALHVAVSDDTASMARHLAPHVAATSQPRRPVLPRLSLRALPISLVHLRLFCTAALHVALSDATASMTRYPLTTTTSNPAGLVCDRALVRSSMAGSPGR